MTLVDWRESLPQGTRVRFRRFDGRTYEGAVGPSWLSDRLLPVIEDSTGFVHLLREIEIERTDDAPL